MSEAKIHEIGNEFYLVKSDEKDLHRNIYIKRFVGKDGKSVNMIFDPGAKIDIKMVTSALKTLIGGVQNLDLIFLSHQDPDLTANLSVLLSSAPKTRFVSSIDTWRLIASYGIPENRFYAIENFKNKVMRIAKTGHRVQFVPAHFCHFRGAMMFYDFESKILFTGDFLGGVDSRNGNGIYATEESWEGISIFHQIYMPSKDAIVETVNKISLLNPLPEIIAPQHGDVIRGDLVVEFLTRFFDMDAGIDLIKKEEPEKDLSLTALNSFMDYLYKNKPEVHEKLLIKLKEAGTFTTIFVLANNSLVDIKVSTKTAIVSIWEIVKSISSPEEIHDFKVTLLTDLDKYNIPLDTEIFEEVGEEKALEEIFDK